MLRTTRIYTLFCRSQGTPLPIAADFAAPRGAGRAQPAAGFRCAAPLPTAPLAAPRPPDFHFPYVYIYVYVYDTHNLQVPEDPSAPKFFKTPGGVKVQELVRGAGPVAAAGDSVLFDYTLRRADGYFVYVSKG